MITTVEKFTKAKSQLDGLVFWREAEEGGIEIKFIPKFKKYIPQSLINYLK